MEADLVNTEDYTCSICREIFRLPMALACLHTYCQRCILALKKSSSSLPNESESAAVPNLLGGTRIHQTEHCFVCAICRKESLGYVHYIEIENKLKEKRGSCLYCGTILTLEELRKHSETCLPVRPSQTGSQLPGIDVTELSQSQAEALQKAQTAENRSTFPCPFCSKTNMSLEHLRQHIRKRHRNEDQCRVCPICASMPWGDKTRVVANIYQHITRRHQFSYDTYVNYEQNEEDMIRQVLAASLIEQ